MWSEETSVQSRTMWSGQISNLAYFEGKKNMGDQSNIKRQQQKKNCDDHIIQVCHKGNTESSLN